MVEFGHLRVRCCDRMVGEVVGLQLQLWKRRPRIRGRPVERRVEMLLPLLRRVLPSLEVLGGTGNLEGLGIRAYAS